MSSETSRIEAFSDGVYAIAITLLILDVHIPTSAPGQLGPALARQWPTYVAFLISFAFIGIMWVNHHRLLITFAAPTIACCFSICYCCLASPSSHFPRLCWQRTTMRPTEPSRRRSSTAPI